jgi:quinol monooxygenase YgiN
METQAMITVIAHFTIEPGMRAEVLAAADAMVAGIRDREPGTLLYLTSTRPAAEQGELEHLDTVEVYKDKAALDAHLAKGGPWDVFSTRAAACGWLKTKPDGPSALDVQFTSGALTGALLNLCASFPGA